MLLRPTATLSLVLTATVGGLAAMEHGAVARDVALPAAVALTGTIPALPSPSPGDAAAQQGVPHDDGSAADATADQGPGPSTPPSEAVLPLEDPVATTADVSVAGATRAAPVDDVTMQEALAASATASPPIAVCWILDGDPAPDPSPTVPLGIDDFAYLRGINAAGGEFEHTAQGLPGRLGVNYEFSSAETFVTLRQRGHRVVRLPFRWERIQHELGGPLSEPGITELRDAVMRAAEADLLVILDMHNYGRYVRSDDVEMVLGAGLTAEHLADAWSRLAGEFADQPAVVGWGIMNEPHALPAPPVTYEPQRSLYTFDSTTEEWRGSGSGHTLEVRPFPGSTGTGALTLTSVLAANSGNFDRIVRLSSPSGFGNVDLTASTTIEYEVYIPDAVPGTWRARGEIQDTAFRWVPSTAYTDVPKGEVVRVRHTVPDHLTGTAHKAIALQLEVDGSDGVSPSVVQVGHVSAGTLSGPGTVTTTWKQASQAAVDAIRATGDARAVFISGDHWGGAHQWGQKNGEPWISDPHDAVVYEAHYYAAPDGSGTYPSYAEAEADAMRRGHASLIARVEAEIGDFTGWLAEHSARGFIGELGWPGTDDATAWNGVGERIYQLLDEAEVGATYWATGERWNPGYPLNPYRFEPFSTQPQAEVIERHPSAAASS